METNSSKYYWFYRVIWIYLILSFYTKKKLYLNIVNVPKRPGWLVQGHCYWFFLVICSHFKFYSKKSIKTRKKRQISNSTYANNVQISIFFPLLHFSRFLYLISSIWQCWCERYGGKWKWKMENETENEKENEKEEKKVKFHSVSCVWHRQELATLFRKCVALATAHISIIQCIPINARHMECV